MANGTDIAAESQAYLNWLYQYLKSVGTYGDPDVSDPFGFWNNQPTQAYQMLVDAQSLLEQEAWGSSYMYSLPFFGDYMNMMQEGQKTFPTQENYSWLEGGQLVAGGQILRTQDGRYVDPNTGIEYDLQTALTMIKNWLGTKDDNSMTQAEEASLDLALKELAWEKEKYGTLSASDKASLQLAYDQLQQTRNEWLANLKANPADWIEKWYAEHLPAGSQMPQNYPWGEPVVGTPAWEQKVGVTGGAATPQTTWNTTPAGGATQTSWGGGQGAQPTTPQIGNPWITGGQPNTQAINNWTGIEGRVTPASLSGAGYNMDSYEQYMRQQPNSSITPEEYYSDLGAYELAAYYNPAYAYGAQQARIALGAGAITPQQYNEIRQANFVDEKGNPLAPQTSAARAGIQEAAMWEKANTPQGYLSMLQARGVSPDQWVSSLSPQASQEMRDYLTGAQKAINTPLPGGNWASYSPDYNWSVGNPVDTGWSMSNPYAMYD
jgi:hypothetical protein